MKKKIILLVTFLLSLNLYAEIVSVYKTSLKKEISYEHFLGELGKSQYIVLGEFHYDLPIQEGEGQIIRDVSSLLPNSSKNVMWEFLNHTDQKLIDKLYGDVLTGTLTANEFIMKTVGGNNDTYFPVINASRTVKAGLIGLNLPRELKQKVIKEGIEAIDPQLVPPSHYLSGKNYYERFVDSMEGHVPSEKLPSYYLAQCLVDSVMSDMIVKTKADLNFIIAGSFHTDFFDGTVEKINKLDSSQLVSVKLIDLDNISEEEKQNFIAGDERFGVFADYLVFVKGEE